MWKPNVGENHLLEFIFIFLYLETSFYNVSVLVQSFTSTQVATCRELQPSLVLQLFLEGCYKPLSSYTSWDTSTQATTCRRLQPSLVI